MSERSILQVVHLLEFLRESDYLHDLHSAFFAILVGSALMFNQNPAVRPFHIWGICVVLVGFFRLLAVVSARPRLHSASCLISLMAWLFFVVVFASHGAYVLSAAYLTFALASLLRYLQVEYWSAAHGEPA